MRNNGIQFVTCTECGNEQADMGVNVACEECGARMPAPPKPRKASQ